MSNVSCSIEISVPFYDVDAMKIVWHGHYVKYMEEARCHLLEQIKYNYFEMQSSGYHWPVIDMRIKYIKPLKFKQVIVIKATISEIDYGLKINFEIIDKKSGLKLSTAYTKQVAVEVKSGEMCLLSPKILKQKIDAFKNQ